MPATMEQLVKEIEKINTQFDVQAQDQNFLGQLNENGKSRFDTMLIAFKDMEARFSNALDYLVPESKINNTNITNGINWINNELKTPNSYNNYSTNNNFSKGFAYLANLSSTMPLPIAESSDRLKDAARSLSGSIGQYQGKHERSIEELESRTDRLNEATNDLEEKNKYIEEQWNELEKDINEKQKSLDRQYSDLQTDFINNQSNRAKTFEDFIKESQQGKSDLLEEMKEFFKEENEKSLETWQNSFQTWSDNVKIQFEGWEKDLHTESDELMNDLRKKQDEAASIVGNVANNGIAGHFANEAENKSKSVWRWRLFTIIAFAATIVVGFFLLIQQVGSDSGSMNLTELISRLVVTAALGSLTAYLAQLASNDEESRKYNSSMEIRLRTLNPYLDAFEDEEQIRLKKELFPVIFREEEKKKKENTEKKMDNKNT